MSQTIKIKGPTKLSGTVNVQGAKNSAMKHVQMPLLSPGIWTLHNIPRIGSTQKLLELLEYQGASYFWQDTNTVTIDSSAVTKATTIPTDLFYYSSGGIFTVNILTSRFGECILDKHPSRKDYGGCDIGSNRNFKDIFDTLALIGISAEENTQQIKFYKTKNTSGTIELPKNTFAGSVNTVLGALFNQGETTITNYTQEAEFFDTIRMLQQAGAEIEIINSKIHINGPAKITPITFSNMYDRMDAATWIAAALAADSSLNIKNINYKEMKLDSMQPVLDAMNVKIEWKDNQCFVPAQLNTIVPTHIEAGMYPMFQTEWHVLFAPLLTQINGTSTVIETMYTNRMRHCDELIKMGADIRYIKDQRYPEKDDNPRAATFTGPATLKGTQVSAGDVRRGASLLIAGLIAHGETTITEIDQIERGYENIVEKLKQLGADITIF